MSRRATSRLVSLTVLLACAATPLLADSFYTVTPCRVFDTRNTSSPLSTNIASTFAIVGSCGVPVEATAVACNTTLLPQGGISVDLGEYPGDQSLPTNTNVVSANSTSSPIAGFSVMTLSNDGQGSVAFLPNSASSGFTDVLFDVSGYFMSDTFPVLWPLAPDDDPGLSDNPGVTYASTLGQGSAAAGPLAAGQGGAGSHYFLSGGKPVPLIGVSADNACHFKMPGAGQCNFGNHLQLLTDAANYGLNVIRLVVNVPLPASGCAYDSVNSDPNDQPFSYDGSTAIKPPNGDGLGRWFLDVRNADYFSRLQKVVQDAAAKNMFVEVTLFAPQQAQHYLSPWSPNHASLSNGTKLKGFADTKQFLDLTSVPYTNNTDPTVYMKPYVLNVVDWTVDALYQSSNVYYEVANEPDWIIDPLPPPCSTWNTKSLTVPATVSAWQDAIVGELRAHMATKGVTQQIAVEAARFADANQFTGAGQYVADASIVNSHYTRLTPPLDTGIADGLGAIRLVRGYYSQPKILGFNETKIVKDGCSAFNHKPGVIESVAEGRAEAWEFMLHQGGVYDQFGYDCTNTVCPPPTTVPAGSDYCETRREMGALRSFLAGPVKIGTNMVTTKDGDASTTPGPPDWINMPAYPQEPIARGTINKFWAAVEPTATAATKRWLLYIHQSVYLGAQFDKYQMPVSKPGQPPLPLHPGETLSVCLGPVSGTYTATWIDPSKQTATGLPIAMTYPNGQPARQTINWTGTTSCTPGGNGSQPLNASPGYAYDIALYISP